MRIFIHLIFLLFFCLSTTTCRATQDDLDLTSKTILVTGGAGFLGSHLCERLLSQGHLVICLDSLLTGDINNIVHLMGNDRFRFVHQDVIQPYDPLEKIDEIYNLACAASPPHYQTDPLHTLKTCISGAFNMLELAKKYDAKIFQSSTSEVYGDPLEHPQKETYWGNVNPNGVRSCYDEGKRCAESIFFNYYRQYGVKIKVGRIFNTYGPKMSMTDGRVVSNFIVQALQGEPISVYGKGEQTRSFCYVDDLIDAFLLFMASDDNITGPINLGNPSEFTVFELAEKIIALTKSSSQIIFLPLPQDDPQKRHPDISLARKLLRWSPKVTLQEGLIETIRYFESILEQEQTIGFQKAA